MGGSKVRMLLVDMYVYVVQTGWDPWDRVWPRVFLSDYAAEVRKHFALYQTLQAKASKGIRHVDQYLEIQDKSV